MGKDEQGSECTKCAKSVFEVVDKCPVCGEQTKRLTWHKRIRVERLAVVGTLGLVGGIVVGVVSGDPVTGLGVLAIATAGLLSAIHTAKFMLGFGGGFVEHIVDAKASAHALRPFDAREYGKELLRVVGILVVLFVVFGVVRLVLGKR